MAQAKKGAAKEEGQTAEGASEAKGGQGRAVSLPNGSRRIDYIRDRYYNDGVSRGDIRKEINAMLEEADRKDEQIPYQIVFAATKEGEKGKPETDPRKKPAKEA